jgi:hypothetical protein
MRHLVAAQQTALTEQPAPDQTECFFRLFHSEYHKRIATEKNAQKRQLQEMITQIEQIAKSSEFIQLFRGHADSHEGDEHEGVIFFEKDIKERRRILEQNNLVCFIFSAAWPKFELFEAFYHNQNICGVSKASSIGTKTSCRQQCEWQYGSQLFPCQLGGYQPRAVLSEIQQGY